MMVHTISGDVWESKRAVITKLYKEEEWPLKHVIKAIQTEAFQPSEPQLRARLKKWHLIKPSRKRYCPSKPASNEPKAYDKLSTTIRLPEAPECSPILADPTPKGSSTVPSLPPREVSTPSELLDFLGRTDHCLDSLDLASDDYHCASYLWPSPGDRPFQFPTTSNVMAYGGGSNTTTMRSPGQGTTMLSPSQDVDSIDLLNPIRKSTDNRCCGIDGGELSAMKYTCVSPSHGRMGTIIPSVDSYHKGSAEAALTVVNPTSKEGSEDWVSSYGAQPLSLPHFSPFEQYQTGLALCRQAVPRLSQRDRFILGFGTRERNKQYGPINLTPESSAALQPSQPQAHTAGNPLHRPCQACLDVSLI